MTRGINTNHYDTIVIGARHAGLASACLPFPGEPYALPLKDNVAKYLQAYAEHFALPVGLNTRVLSLASDAHRFVVATDAGTFIARSVIVATGAYHRPHIPAFASALSPNLVQIHSSEYRNPDVLPPGSVIVVGAGNSGAQIALELAESGRPTSRRALLIPNLTSVGRTVGVSNGHPRLDDGRVLEDVCTVVWCTGFRPDFRWIQLPIFGPEGYSKHRRGIVGAAPGLASLDCGTSTESVRR